MNRLKNEISPYLLQHYHNPVHWQPWDSAALKEARDRDIPIFLSSGYSSCHWCHVMERESFSDNEVAEALNSGFVCIKVDREERPDIDSLYMNFCHILTGSGGWPLTIIMTPELLPFFAATYLPKRTTGNVRGIIDVATLIKGMWRDNRSEIESLAARLYEHLKAGIREASKDYPFDLNKLPDEAFHTLGSIYDTQNGGFGRRPKFPMPVYLSFLLAYHRATGSKEALTMVSHTLQSIQSGGIYDHAGKGFHRYATDEAWRVPHFEKMLYDQALLIKVYVEAYVLTQNDLFRKTALDVIEYVLRELCSPEGLFYTAEDADSEGSEGVFYTWTMEELKRVLDDNELYLLLENFELSDKGNFEETGRNILYYKKGRHTAQLSDVLNKLYHVRSERNRPFKDRKSLTDWNSLMISALVMAGEVFGEHAFINGAIKTAHFIRENLYNPMDGLFHIYMDGHKRIGGLLDDYAFYINSLLELYRVTAEGIFLEWAVETTQYVISHFKDQTGKGFYLTHSASTTLPIRQKDITDNVVPSGSGIMMDNLLRLYSLTGDLQYRALAQSIPDAMPATIGSSPASCCTILTTFLRHL